MQIQLYNAWILTAGFFVTGTALLLLMPRYNVGAFVKSPKMKYVTMLNKIGYYGFLLSALFIPFDENTLLFYTGLVIWFVGMLLYVYALFSFAVKEFNKPVTDRFYSVSRHPVYLSFFIVSTGIVIASFSLLLASFACIYFVSSYFIMKEEEKKCLETYGDEYRDYMKQTRMII